MTIARNSKVTPRRSNKDHLLAGALETLRYIVNLKFPYESNHDFAADVERAPWLPAGKDSDPVFLNRVRHRTQKYWPELWTTESSPPPELTLHKMRTYLRRFWLAQNDRERDWHVHRAREFYQDSRIRHATQGVSERISSAQSIDELRDRYLDWNQKREDILDEPPPLSHFEDALFEMQERARFPSTRPLKCANCIQKPPSGPFFLSDKKGTKFCSPECSIASQRRSKNKSWATNKEKWRGR
jgi:hypothetical protein